MKYDQYGVAYCCEEDLSDLLYSNPDLDISKFQVLDPEKYNHSVSFFHLDTMLLKKYTQSTKDLELFDHEQQNNWKMPNEYKNFDIVAWLLDQCKDQTELQRTAEELFLFEQRNLLDLLRYLKYFVDTMRKNDVLWGLGRGSSVASFVLYLIGVHKINSIYYDLDIREFLKND